VIAIYVAAKCRDNLPLSAKIIERVATSNSRHAVSCFVYRRILIRFLRRDMYVTYIRCLERTMTKAKLFTTGGSQAVRLPAQFRFEGDEVDIRRDALTGDVVLSKPIASWDEYFDWVRKLDLPSDVLRERDQPVDDMRDLLPRRRRG
jgi:antitoxin VapB